MIASILSTATVTTVGLTCKAFLNLGFCSLEVNGLSTLVNALRSDRRNNGQGIVTVANHISTLDDPLMWGVLPARHYLASRTTRWALGASDIMFTNPVISTFFRHGQVLETFRGKGPYQAAIDTAIDKLNHGAWVHLFGEGKVNQPNSYAQTNGFAHLPRFKWGVGRILMETNIPPITVPIWLSGFEQLMPEGRCFPYKYIPRLGARLRISIGSPVPPGDFEAVVQCRIGENRPRPDDRSGWLSERNIRDVIEQDGNVESEMQSIRSEMTAVMHSAVEALGKEVAGDLLGGKTKLP